MAALNQLKADVDALKKGAQSPERGAPQPKTRKHGHRCKSCNENENNNVLIVSFVALMAIFCVVVEEKLLRETNNNCI